MNVQGEQEVFPIIDRTELQMPVKMGKQHVLLNPRRPLVLYNILVEEDIGLEEVGVSIFGRTTLVAVLWQSDGFYFC